MADKYSFLSLARHALSGHKNWDKAWRSPALKSSYDVVIIGGGGHGLATAYYLAKNHGITNIAVIEKGYIGGGNSGRNTQVVRSNYFYPESSDFYERSLQLYEGLTRDLNCCCVLVAAETKPGSEPDSVPDRIQAYQTVVSNSKALDPSNPEYAEWMQDTHLPDSS